MSTILKTLKKLEEEKSILDQKLDLKEMILKEQYGNAKEKGNNRLSFFLILAIALGVFFFGGIGLNYWLSTLKVPERVLEKNIPKTPLRQKQSLENPKKTSSFEGVSMAAIPNSKKKTTAQLEQPLDFLKQFTTKHPEAETLMPTVANDYQEIKQLIQAATSSAKNSPPLPVASHTNYVPGVKIKGIVFFDEGSSSNHTIVTTSGENNLKLRVGDSAQNALLKSIHPNSVIFLYQNQLVEMGIGQ